MITTSIPSGIASCFDKGEYDRCSKPSPTANPDCTPKRYASITEYVRSERHKRFHFYQWDEPHRPRSMRILQVSPCNAELKIDLSSVFEAYSQQSSLQMCQHRKQPRFDKIKLLLEVQNSISCKCLSAQGRS